MILFIKHIDIEGPGTLEECYTIPDNWDRNNIIRIIKKDSIYRR